MSIACKWVHCWWGISNKISAWIGWTVKDRLIWTLCLNKENNNPSGNKADPKRVVKSRVFSQYTHKWLVCLPPCPDISLCFLKSLPYWPSHFHTAVIFRAEIFSSSCSEPNFLLNYVHWIKLPVCWERSHFPLTFFFHTQPQNTFYYLRRITSRTVLQKWYCPA